VVIELIVVTCWLESEINSTNALAKSLNKEASPVKTLTSPNTRLPSSATSKTTPLTTQTNSTMITAGPIDIMHKYHHCYAIE